MPELAHVGNFTPRSLARWSGQADDARRRDATNERKSKRDLLRARSAHRFTSSNTKPNKS